MQSLAKLRALEPLPPRAVHLQSRSYVDVKMRWKKDASFDAVPVLSHSRDLRPLASLARLLSPSPTPVSAVSKLGRSLEIPDRRVTSFLRRFPAAFVESVGPQHNLPWFRLSDAAAHLLREERDVFAARRADITGYLRRLILMCPRRHLPLRVAQGMLWHLGIPEDYFKNPDHGIAQDGLRILTSGGGGIDDDDDGRELGLIDDGKVQEMPLSVLQMNAMRKSGSVAEVPIPLFQSKGFRLKQKIKDWLEGFQRLHYVSPYEDFSHIHRGSDVSQKRAVGVLHELLSLFVTCSAERWRLLCLRQHLGLPQKFHLVFERHPHVFYLLLKEKTCFIVLKEAYMAGGDTAIGEHPMLEVRKKFVELMEESREIIRCRRGRKPTELESKWCDDQQPMVGAPVQASPQYQTDAMPSIQNSSMRSSSSCFKCGQENHCARDCPNQSSDPYPDKGARTITSASSPDGCFKCGKSGHWSRECPTSNSGGTVPSRAKSSSALGGV